MRRTVQNHRLLSEEINRTWIRRKKMQLHPRGSLSCDMWALRMCAGWRQLVARSTEGYKYTERVFCHFTPGKISKRSSCFNSDWTELLLSSSLLFQLVCIPDTKTPSLVKHYRESRRKALFLYRFVKKKHKKTPAKMDSQVRQNYHRDCEAAINRMVNMELFASYTYTSMVSEMTF